jgi:hypothetical protein
MAGGKRIHKTVHHFQFKVVGGLLAAQESEVDEVAPRCILPSTKTFLLA